MLVDINTTRDAVRAEIDRFSWDSIPHKPQTRHNHRSSVWQSVAEKWKRHRTRQRIAALDAEMLKAIGINLSDAAIEANNPFWLPDRRGIRCARLGGVALSPVSSTSVGRCGCRGKRGVLHHSLYASVVVRVSTDTFARVSAAGAWYCA
jgi:uncharacterized protein YjiS (DUF1127 family)